MELSSARHLFLKSNGCSSGCNRMPKGGIWLGLSSKDLLNLQLKTELYAVLWVEVESFKQYCIESWLGLSSKDLLNLQCICIGSMFKASNYRIKYITVCK